MTIVVTGALRVMSKGARTKDPEQTTQMRRLVSPLLSAYGSLRGLLDPILDSITYLKVISLKLIKSPFSLPLSKICVSCKIRKQN